MRRSRPILLILYILSKKILSQIPLKNARPPNVQSRLNK